MAEEPSGFLGRWARRKTDVLQGKPLDEPALLAKAPSPGLPAGAVPGASAHLPAATVPGMADPAAAATAPPESEPAPSLSLDDVRQLTKDSDFKPFMARGVGPEVRNAAMKKLFADPHFNIMDGLDIYIDDYSISDPIPESMLRQMTSAKFLKLFDDEEDDEKTVKTGSTEKAAPQAWENADGSPDQTVAQSGPGASEAIAPSSHPEYSSHTAPLPEPGDSQENHVHTDLRLQPDHAATDPEAGRGTQ